MRLEKKNCNTILREKQQKYQYYHQIHKYEYLTGEETLPSGQSRMTDQT